MALILECRRKRISALSNARCSQHSFIFIGHLVFMTITEASVTATSVPEDIRKLLIDLEKYQNLIPGTSRGLVQGSQPERV